MSHNEDQRLIHIESFVYEHASILQAYYEQSKLRPKS